MAGIVLPALAPALASVLTLAQAALPGSGPGPVPAPVAAAPAVAAPAEASPPLVGGYAPMARDAAELRAVVRAAVAHLTPARHARARVIAAERQVVAGINYRVVLQLRDGSRWRVTVWQRLDGTREVTEALRLPA